MVVHEVTFFRLFRPTDEIVTHRYGITLLNKEVFVRRKVFMYEGVVLRNDGFIGVRDKRSGDDQAKAYVGDTRSCDCALTFRPSQPKFGIGNNGITAGPKEEDVHRVPHLQRR